MSAHPHRLLLFLFSVSVHPTGYEVLSHGFDLHVHSDW